MFGVFLLVCPRYLFPTSLPILYGKNTWLDPIFIFWVEKHISADVDCISLEKSNIMCKPVQWRVNRSSSLLMPLSFHFAAALHITIDSIMSHYYKCQ